jgi:hypothetical protein
MPTVLTKRAKHSDIQSAVAAFRAEAEATHGPGVRLISTKTTSPLDVRGEFNWDEVDVETTWVVPAKLPSNT